MIYIILTLIFTSAIFVIVSRNVVQTVLYLILVILIYGLLWQMYLTYWGISVLDVIAFNIVIILLYFITYLLKNPKL